VRHTQLDSSTLRRGQETVASAEDPVPIRYLPPLLATGAGALLITCFFAFFANALLRLTYSFAIAPTPEGESFLLQTGFCGIFTLLVLGATAYFGYASFTALRDMLAHPLTVDGAISGRHTGRGRWGGGYWIIVRPGAPPAVSLDPGADAALPAFVPPQQRGFVTGSGGSFGAQLETTAAEPPAPTAREANAEATARLEAELSGDTMRRPLEPGEINLRVEKHIYEALSTGDRVQVVYSPYLQHVYYVRKRWDTGGALILRNMALI
jgi:hypothetical protein